MGLKEFSTGETPKKTFTRDILYQLPETVTLYEVAQTLGVAYRTVRNWRNKFDFPTFRCDTENNAKRRKFARSDLIRWLVKTSRVKG